MKKNQWLNVKFKLYEKHKVFKNLLMLGRLQINAQSMSKISQIFLCFSKSPNFMKN